MILPRFVDNALKRILEKKGYFRLKGQNGFELERRRKLLASLKIDLLIDIGANVGQYGEGMRRLGYRGRIISFEPMRKALSLLEPLARTDGRWEVVPMGLSDIASKAHLHIAGNSISSSLLDMDSLHESLAPGSAYVAEEEIEVTTLDQVMASRWKSEQRVWLKIDVQGLEDKVLAGATKTLEKVACIQLELSLQSLYTGQTTYLPLLNRLHTLGFDLAGVEAGFVNLDNGRLMQMDGLLVRRGT